MKIIISPAKKMEDCGDIFAPGSHSEFLERTRLLYARLKDMDEAQLKELFGANDAITHENFLRFQSMDLDRAQTPAVLSYVGIQYQYMAPKLFSYGQWEYVKEHLRILSGFYGILKPDDRVTPYRLEMQAKLSADGAKDLYGFWGRSLYDALLKDEPEGRRTVINLASKEYSKAIEKYLTKEDRYVTCVFGQLKDGAVKVKATEAKMARGEMVRFLSNRQVKEPEGAKDFSALGFQFDEGRSTDDTFVYLKTGRSPEREEES